ncbi:MAG: DUF4926 domain-containing protein [Burkholderiales bacterium]|nr:DUF4926 domain-containing protein [Burkholderiales bacterium]
MISDLDVVSLKRALPSAGLEAGARGTVVSVFAKPRRAYLVEFADDQGETVATEVLDEQDLGLVWSAPAISPERRAA